MKTLFKIFIALISVVLLTTMPERTHSCGPSLETDEVRLALFRPEMIGDDALTGFGYTHDYLNGGPSVGNDYKLNCEEWRTFTRGEASVGDIYQVQYETKPDVFLYAYNTGDWSDFTDNTFARWLTRKQNKEALEYMAIAKRIEFDQMDRNDDPWDDGGKSGHADMVGYMELTEKLEKPLPEFLRQRYAFQAVKVVYYLNHSVTPFNHDSTLISIYDKYLKGKKTIVSDWGMLYYAFAQPTGTLQNLYLLRTFDRSDEKKHYAYQWLDSEGVDSLATYVTTKEDRLMVDVIKTIRTPDRALEKIGKIYTADPGNKYLPLLITREINKLEDWIWSPEVLGFSPEPKVNAFEKQSHIRKSRNGDWEADTNYAYYLDKNLRKDRAYLTEVQEYLKYMLAHGGADRNFLRMSIAHLSNMNGDYAAANSYLSQVSKTGRAVYDKQVAIDRLISLMHTADITHPAGKQKVFDLLQYLKNAGVGMKPYEDGYYWAKEPDDDLNELLVMLSKRYRAHGDIVTAALLMQKARINVNEYTGYLGSDSITYVRLAYFDRYGTTNDIDSLLAFRNKSNKTAFEQYIAEEIAAPVDFYLDLKGTMLIREKKFREALTVFNQINDSFWAQNYEYESYLPKMYIGSVGTYISGVLGPRKQYAYTSKKLIIKDVVAIEDALASAVTTENKARQTFLLANVYFNLTWGGKGWMMYSYGKSSRGAWGVNYDWVSYNFISNDKQKMRAFYNYADAMEMYRRALSTTKDNELEAQCLLMLGYCDKYGGSRRKEMKGIEYYGNDDDYKSPYYRSFASKYEHTRTYYWAVGCPDVQ
ncbi:hypothetical protein [Polluticoccus soli]|uniref:hypothetical protein n=1 Tax=Polluticoccus soli TaxID=3034150 RepID=UPI0023E3436B|nr:hypothetical protein [Flavipsychrobacter sp. JY13-12]